MFNPEFAQDIDFEYFHSDTESSLQGIYDTLVDKGFSDEEANNMIDSLWGVISGEYGC
jgi:hypothetical protein